MRPSSCYSTMVLCSTSLYNRPHITNNRERTLSIFRIPALFGELHRKIETHVEFNEKCDVYSFAVVIYEIMSCCVPWTGVHPMMIGRYCYDKNLRPDENTEGSPALDGLRNPDMLGLMRICWNQDPEQRPTFSTIVTMIKEIKPDPTRSWCAPSLLD